jgi:hypothetical protein
MAGKVLVSQRVHGLIPRMLHVRVNVSFDMRRATHSICRNVFCCSGALTAVRADAVRTVLECLRNPHLLSSRWTFGEDRAMTDYLRDSGYAALWQRAVVAHTLVRHAFGKLCRIRLRGDPSSVREALRFARNVWQRPWPMRPLASFDRFITNGRLPISSCELAVPPRVLARDPGSTVPMPPVMAGCCCSPCSTVCAASERSISSTESRALTATRLRSSGSFLMRSPP